MNQYGNIHAARKAVRSRPWAASSDAVSKACDNATLSVFRDPLFKAVVAVADNLDGEVKIMDIYREDMSAAVDELKNVLAYIVDPTKKTEKATVDELSRATPSAMESTDWKGFSIHDLKQSTMDILRDICFDPEQMRRAFQTFPDLARVWMTVFVRQNRDLQEQIEHQQGIVKRLEDDKIARTEEIEQLEDDIVRLQEALASEKTATELWKDEHEKHRKTEIQTLQKKHVQYVSRLQQALDTAYNGETETKHRVEEQQTEIKRLQALMETLEEENGQLKKKVAYGDEMLQKKQQHIGRLTTELASLQDQMRGQDTSSSSEGVSDDDDVEQELRALLKDKETQLADMTSRLSEAERKYIAEAVSHGKQTGRVQDYEAKVYLLNKEMAALKIELEEQKELVVSELEAAKAERVVVAGGRDECEGCRVLQNVLLKALQ
jgi:chromosome segregation ATPase